MHIQLFTFAVSNNGNEEETEMFESDVYNGEEGDAYVYQGYVGPSDCSTSIQPVTISGADLPIQSASLPSLLTAQQKVYNRATDLVLSHSSNTPEIISTVSSGRNCESGKI